jgi:hypothetical protein
MLINRSLANYLARTVAGAPLLLFGLGLVEYFPAKHREYGIGLFLAAGFFTIVCLISVAVRRGLEAWRSGRIGSWPPRGRSRRAS